MELPVSNVPVTLISGALGVGKTTAIRGLFAHRPEGERWAVLVNEFGEVGIDGAVLESGGLSVREVPGGCICCSAGLSMRAALVRLLREIRPDRLIIEPTGLAHPASVLDQLRSPGLREAVSLRATITLVDPRRFTSADPSRWGTETPGWSRPLGHGGFDPGREDAWHDQVVAADVLVANRCDLADAATVEAFRQGADQLFPPPLVVATTTFGALDPAWLHLDPSPERTDRRAHVHDRPAHVAIGADPSDDAEAPSGPRLVPEEEGSTEEGRRHPAEAGAYATCGWIFPPSVAFHRRRLELALQTLVRPGDALPAGVERLKGIFRTPRVWLKVDATSDEIRWEALNYRRDSRVEIIAAAEPPPDWDAVEAALRAARFDPRTDRGSL